MALSIEPDDGGARESALGLAWYWTVRPIPVDIAGPFGWEPSRLTATTLNLYAHFLEATDRQAADVIGGLLD